jgi:hypothetical protein
MEKKYLTVIEVGEIYGIKRNALYKLFREKKLSKYFMNGTKVSVKELDEYAESVKEPVDEE